MPSLQRSPRIVTFCPIGRTASPGSQGRRRMVLMRRAVEQLVERHWAPIDAVLFPGGYFRSASFVGDLPYDERVDVLKREPFVQAAIEICGSQLDELIPGAALIFGVDTDHPSSKLHGDHLAVACTSRGIAAVGRKIFPTTTDTRRGRPSYVPADIDFSQSSRFLTLPNGSRALLCACYDAFGVAERPGAVTIRSHAIRHLLSDGLVVDGWDAEFADVRKNCLAAWRRRLSRERPDVVLTAIHGFAQPGREGYWQRHGIALASAALDGALSVGAAHFRHALPLRAEQSPLAAAGVPSRHLLEGAHRRMWRHDPADSCEVFHRRVKHPDGVLRLYTIGE